IFIPKLRTDLNHPSGVSEIAHACEQGDPDSPSALLVPGAFVTVADYREDYGISSPKRRERTPALYSAADFVSFHMGALRLSGAPAREDFSRGAVFGDLEERHAVRTARQAAIADGVHSNARCHRHHRAFGQLARQGRDRPLPRRPHLHPDSQAGLYPHDRPLPGGAEQSFRYGLQRRHFPGIHSFEKPVYHWKEYEREKIKIGHREPPAAGDFAGFAGGGSRGRKRRSAAGELFRGTEQLLYCAYRPHATRAAAAAAEKHLV